MILFVPELPGGDQAFSWSEGFTASAEVPLSQRRGELRLAGGNFDADRHAEVALAYQGNDGNLHIEIFDGNGTPQIQRSASFSGIVAPSEGTDSLLHFDLSAGDFDADGRDELALAAIAENVNNSGFWGIYLRLFEVSDSSIVPRSTHFIVGPEVVATLDSNANPGYLSVAAGNFDDDVAAEIVVGYGLNQGSSGVRESFAVILDVTPDLVGVFERDRRRVDQNGGNFRNIALGDMNLDGIDELHFYTAGSSDGQLELYRIDDQGKLAGLSGNAGFINSRGSSRRPAVMADLNRDLRAELIVASYAYNGDNQRQETEISPMIIGADSVVPGVMYLPLVFR